MSAVTFAIEVLNALPGLVKEGIEIAELAAKAADKLRDLITPLSDDEWDDLNAEIEDLRSQRPDV